MIYWIVTGSCIYFIMKTVVQKCWLGVYDIGHAKIGIMDLFLDWFFPEVARCLVSKRGVILSAIQQTLVLSYCPQAMITRCIENRVFAITANRIGVEKRSERIIYLPRAQARFWERKGRFYIKSLFRSNGRSQWLLKSIQVTPALQHVTAINHIWWQTCYVSIRSRSFCRVNILIEIDPQALRGDSLTVGIKADSFDFSEVTDVGVEILVMAGYSGCQIPRWNIKRQADGHKLLTRKYSLLQDCQIGPKIAKKDVRAFWECGK